MRDIVIAGARPRGGEVCDILVRDGQIAARGKAIDAAPDARRIDGAGCLLLPGLVDAHTHLDKTLIGLPWHAHRAGPNLIDKITNERAVMAELGLDPALQSARMVRHMLSRGTTAIRSHVDIGLDNKLSHFYGVARTRDADASLSTTAAATDAPHTRMPWLRMNSTSRPPRASARRSPSASPAAATEAG